MAYEWNKTAFVEFEAMLQRRLRSGAAPVAACAGFDLDAASAYLEDALGGSHRAGYESHLAGCAACRRHLIELSRLARCAPQTEAQPVTVMDQTPARLRWREVVAGWFNLSAWNLKWQIAGATGAAFAILIAVLGVQSWRQSSNRAADMASIPSAATSPATEAGIQPFQSPNPEPSPQGAINPASEDLAANNQRQLQIPAPMSLAGSRLEELAAGVTASDKAMRLRENQSAEAPGAARPVGGEAAQNPLPQTRSSEELTSVSNASGSVLIRDDSKEQGANDIVQALRITPSQIRNPMNPEQPDPNHQTPEVEGRKATMNFLSRESQPPNSTQPKKPSEPLKLPGIARSMISRIKSRPKSESERNADAEASEKKSPTPMLIPIRDKVFRFERGVLIDQEYNPEMQKWRVWALKSGSEAYKQVLANEPLLKEFFDRGPILIVWKNRIYKVLK
jgi:hypothetical protein